jgi:hypothetical protein
MKRKKLVVLPFRNGRARVQIEFLCLALVDILTLRRMGDGICSRGARRGSARLDRNHVGRLRGDGARDDG